MKCAFDSISPFVRFAGTMNFEPFETTFMRLAYDNRLFLFKSGNADLIAEDRSYSLHAGDAILMLAGVPYRFEVKDKPVVFYVVNFDFFNYEHQSLPPLPLPMCDKENFSKATLTENITFECGFLDKKLLIQKGAFHLYSYIKAMVDEYKRLELLYLSQLSSLLKICLNDIYRHFFNTQKPKAINSHADILDYLSKHFTEDLTNRSIADIFHYHPNYVNHLIRTQTGLSLHKYLLRLRMLKAADLLLSGNQPINEISRQCGFQDPSYFSQYFHRLFGCTPSLFRGQSDK